MKTQSVLLMCFAFAVPAFGEVVTFQQSVGGYTSCHDTWIDDGVGDNSTSGQVLVDLSGDAWNRHGLIRFGQVFMSEGGPIPDGARIYSAILTVKASTSGSGWMFFRMKQSWQDTDTWHTDGSPTKDGVIEADVEYVGDTGTGVPRTGYSNVDAIVQPINPAGKVFEIDVIASVRAWSDGTTPKYGWVVHSYAQANSGFYSSEAETVADRPLLTVDYVVTHNLAVRSAPITGVDIIGDKPGTTNYTATCDDQEVVNLTAPAALPGEGITRHHFLYWMVDNGPRPYSRAELQLTMDGDHSAVAIYDRRLDGDTNGDGKVNLLDIIYVRGKLYMQCEQ